MPEPAPSPQNPTSPQNHYELLGLSPTASPQAIRRAYRDLSKLYHPDTTTLPPAIATEKFQALNNAYGTLSNPERRLAYDHQIGYSRISVMQVPAYLNRPVSRQGDYQPLKNAYLDPTDRPLSPGEIFALFILGLTFVACLALVVAISWTQGDFVLTFPTTTPVEATVQSPDPTTPTGLDAPLASARPSPEITPLARPSELASTQPPLQSPTQPAQSQPITAKASTAPPPPLLEIKAADHSLDTSPASEVTIELLPQEVVPALTRSRLETSSLSTQTPADLGTPPEHATRPTS